jgi:hypothetical protein
MTDRDDQREAAHQDDLNHQEQIERSYKAYIRALTDYHLKHGGYEQWSQDLDNQLSPQ